MAAPDPYTSTDEEFTITHWKEFVANFRPSGPNSFSQEGGEAGLTGYIPAARVRGALRFFVGYNNVATSSPYYIQRTNPPYHPRFTNLMCVSAAEEEFVPKGTYNSGVGVKPKKAANSALNFSGSPLYIAPAITFRANYDLSRLTLRFVPVTWPMAEDSAIDRAHEYQRNTVLDIEPRTEFLSLDGFRLIYAEGAANTPPLTNPVGKEFPAPFGQILVKPDVTFLWKHVPKRFVMVNNLPTAILAGVGKVNSSAWNGYTAGTLLLLGVKMIRTTWALAAGTEELYNYQITFMFGYFNPTKGKTSDVQIASNFGWNNMPWRGNATEAAIVAGDTNAGKWFLSTRTGGNGAAAVDPRLIEEYDYNLLFRQAV